MLKIDAYRAIWTGAIELRMAQVKDGKVYIAQPLAFDTQPVDGDFVNSVVSLNPDAAQTLMDSLWNCGVRPTEGTGSAGSLKATENHLKDMQKIAFHFLENSNASRY